MNPYVCENDFPSFKTQFLSYSMKQAFYLLHKLNIARACQQENTFMQAFCTVPSGQTCMCKRGIRHPCNSKPTISNEKRKK